MRKLYLFALFLVIYEFTTYIANDMIMPGMLSVVHEFGAPLSYVSLSLSLYILGNSALQLFLGPLAERFGKRKVILTGNILFIVFTMFIMTAQNIHTFMLGRLLEGTGMGFIAMGYALIHEKFDDKQAVKIFALMANVSLLAPLFGPLLGALVIKVMGWRYIFIIISILAIFALYGLYRYTPAAVDFKPAAFNFISSLKTYGQIICKEQFTLGTLCTTVAAMPTLCWIALAPTIIMKTAGLNVMYYAVYQLLSIGGLTFSSVLMQFIAGRFSFYQLIISTVFIGFGGLLLGVIFHTNLNIIVLGMFIYCFGLGVFNNLIMRLVMTTPGVSHSMVTSLMVFIQTILFAIGIEITNRIMEIYGYSVFSFTLVNFGLACCFLVLVCVYAYKNRHKKWE